jgi:hypothetical protein
MTKTQTQDPPEKLETVRLLKPHTHAGKPRPAGAAIRVDEPTAAWLRAAGVVAAKTEPGA